MAWGETKFVAFEGHVEPRAWTNKAIKFQGDDWPEPEWLPRRTKNGDPIIQIVRHDHDSGEACIEIAEWLVNKHPEWQ